eukprot:snap_masked-scaffold_40-processed-gene-2.35-mRNA-1 protein AED:1.00 eAED:1.00 QI:0/0/0/0/1/1/2/0/227
MIKTETSDIESNICDLEVSKVGRRNCFERLICMFEKSYVLTIEKEELENETIRGEKISIFIVLVLQLQHFSIFLFDHFSYPNLWNQFRLKLKNTFTFGISPKVTVENEVFIVSSMFSGILFLLWIWVSAQQQILNNTEVKQFRYFEIFYLFYLFIFFLVYIIQLDAGLKTTFLIFFSFAITTVINYAIRKYVEHKVNCCNDKFLEEKVKQWRNISEIICCLHSFCLP